MRLSKAERLARTDRRIAARRASGTVDDVAAYAFHIALSHHRPIDGMGLTIPELSAALKLEAAFRARKRAKAEAAAREAERQRAYAAAHPPVARLTVPKSALISTGVRETLGCTLSELNRWASDGRLKPDGERWSSLGGSYHRWLRAWLPSTVAAAAPHVEAWREQDRVRRAFSRRGLREAPVAGTKCP